MTAPVHPIVKAVRRSLPRPRPRGTDTFLALLDRRLAGLRRVAEGHPASWRERASERALARRFVGRLAGRWDDGAENLVRGYLDRWSRPGDDARRAAARGLLEAAEDLARIEAPPAALWFLLWEMESVAGSVLADKLRGAC